MREIGDFRERDVDAHGSKPLTNKCTFSGSASSISLGAFDWIRIGAVAATGDGAYAAQGFGGIGSAFCFATLRNQK